MVAGPEMRFGTQRQAAEAGVRAAVQALAAGRVVVVADDREREDEGDLVAAAALMSAEQMAFFLRHGSGIVCAPMPDERATISTCRRGWRRRPEARSPGRLSSAP